MTLNIKSISIFISLISLGIICGAVIFIPIFEDKFMGPFMGFLIGAGLWLSTGAIKSK